AGAAGDALGRACEGEAACHRGGAVDAGEAAVRDHARGGGAGELLEVAYEARGAEDQQVPVTGRLPDGERGLLLPEPARRGGLLSGGAPSGELLTACVEVCWPDLVPGRGEDHEARAAGDVGPVGVAVHDDDLDVLRPQQRADDGAGERGVTEHDRSAGPQRV